MAGGGAAERRQGGGAGQDLRRRGDQSAASLNRLVYLKVHIAVAVTIMAYLAFTWSTVVLLGGFVGSVRRKDFTCLTIITLIEATRIFNDMESDKPRLDLRGFAANMALGGRDVFTRRTRSHSSAARIFGLSSVIISGSLMPVIYVVLTTVTILYAYGPFIGLGLSAWRLRYRDYADAHSRNMSAALDIFYRLVLSQGILYMYLAVSDVNNIGVVSSVCEHYGLQRDWGLRSVVEYLEDTREKCTRDPASINRRNLVQYAGELLDSGSWEDHLSGVKILDAFVKNGADVRPLLLPSRPKIQKLIDTLGWRSCPGDSTEIRGLAARILAEIAGDIHLAQFPGAILCVSSLLEEETTQTCISGRQEHRRIKGVGRCQEDYLQSDDEEDGWSGHHNEIGRSCNEQILQGLTVLERLASNQHNCRVICSAPGLVPKIMAPLYTDTLIQDISGSDAWVDVVNRCFKVVNRLIRAPGETGVSLRLEISSNKQALSNLERILDQGTSLELLDQDNNEAGLELLVQAMLILTELVLDMYIKLPTETKENFIKKQLQIFLADEEAPPAMLKLKANAGATLALLSTNSKSNSAIIMKEYDDIVGRLTKMLEAKNNIMYRTKAAEIIENLCAHCVLDKQHVTETLLPQVLTGIMSTKTKPVQDEHCAPGNDEENQNSSAHGSKRRLCRQRNEDNATKALLEAFLSLIVLIYDKVISADDFHDVLQKNTKQHIFVARIKTIVEDNCQPTVESLRIVKLCSQIAVSMMQRSMYTEEFRNQEFVKSLSEAKATLSKLESRMLFTGTDVGKNTARPLLSALEKEAQVLVGYTLL
ncbi:hypothetical protein C2845_PM17G04130 [Panicum miliaceum]|uniref:Uncharacterized protein n=1 Tax=Panicum miliaceum TaxID=4540 RepID=A0A3L6Q186_PANMI|nr:hypothetical protein C2845_PM17G04130 [Panicum miliaceum]